MALVFLNTLETTHPKGFDLTSDRYLQAGLARPSLCGHGPSACWLLIVDDPDADVGMSGHAEADSVFARLAVVAEGDPSVADRAGWYYKEGDPGKGLPASAAEGVSVLHRKASETL